MKVTFTQELLEVQNSHEEGKDRRQALCSSADAIKTPLCFWAMHLSMFSDQGHRLNDVILMKPCFVCLTQYLYPVHLQHGTFTITTFY